MSNCTEKIKTDDFIKTRDDGYSECSNWLDKGSNECSDWSNFLNDGVRKSFSENGGI